MELKLNTSTCHSLRKAVSQVLTQEQTQEVRLPDAMPDIGRVLGSWGQVLVRGKEWRGSGMSVSGGVMAWVLYAPEDGTQVRCMEAWVPFQMKWDFPETQRDGFICAVPLLKAVDARSTSARKLMVRANVSLLGEALEPVETEIYHAGELPEDVQLLQQSYPMELPQESGEKLFQMEEELTLPGTFPSVEKILRYEFHPQVSEHKVMAGRLVFRGSGKFRLLYCGEDENLNSWECDLPFSQYTELDRDYGPNASAWMTPILTGLEVDVDEQQRLQLKSSIAAQYVIYDRIMVDLVEDAYSTDRSVIPQTDTLDLSMCLDQKTEPIDINHTMNVKATRVMDVCWYPEHPVCRQNGDITELRVPGHFQVLYYDENGNLQCGNGKSESVLNMPSDPQNNIAGYIRMKGSVQAIPGTESMELSGQAELDTAVFTEQGLCMVTGLELGEIREPDPERPSLVLRRTGEQRLWDIAKECNSTVQAIREANKLKDEPEEGQMLLIPVS